MKAKDLKPCALCGHGVMHTRVPLFYRVRIESMGIDMQAVQRAHGMEQFFGGAVALARAFEDPEIAKPLGNERIALVCQACALESTPLAVLSEMAAETTPI